MTITPDQLGLAEEVIKMSGFDSGSATQNQGVPPRQAFGWGLIPEPKLVAEDTPLQELIEIKMALLKRLTEISKIPAGDLLNDNQGMYLEIYDPSMLAVVLKHLGFKLYNTFGILSIETMGEVFLLYGGGHHTHFEHLQKDFDSYINAACTKENPVAKLIRYKRITKAFNIKAKFVFGFKTTRP